MILQSIIVEGFSFCEEIKLFPARKFYKRTKPKIIIYPPPLRRLSAHITSTRIELRNGGKIVYCLSTQYRDHTINYTYFFVTFSIAAEAVLEQGVCPQSEAEWVNV